MKSVGRTILLGNPRGFCAGVDRAVAIVEQLLEEHGAPVYVRKQIVHNAVVVKRLTDLGAVFIEEVDEAPEGAVLVFSAHGVAPSVRQRAEKRRLRAVDATCPLVTKVHTEAIRFSNAGFHILLIGHATHDEIIGTMGEIAGNVTVIEDIEDARTVEVSDPNRVAVLTQTTFSMDEVRDIMTVLRQRFPAFQTPAREDVCYAAQNRQDAVRELAAQVDVVLVVGSPNSHGAQRLVDLARQLGSSAHLLDDPSEIQQEWFEGADRVGITAWASSPEYLTQAIVKRIKDLGARQVIEIGTPEPKMVFAMPRELKAMAANLP